MAQAIARCFRGKTEDEGQSEDGIDQGANGGNRVRKYQKSKDRRREDRAYDALQYEGG